MEIKSNLSNLFCKSNQLNFDENKFDISSTFFGWSLGRRGSNKIVGCFPGSLWCHSGVALGSLWVVGRFFFPGQAHRLQINSKSLGRLRLRQHDATARRWHPNPMCPPNSAGHTWLIFGLMFGVIVVVYCWGPLGGHWAAIWAEFPATQIWGGDMWRISWGGARWLVVWERLFGMSVVIRNKC